MTDLADLPLRSSTGEPSRLLDLIGQVVLVVAGNTPLGSFDLLLDRYRADGLAVLAGDPPGEDGVTLIGRDGQAAARFPAGSRADDPALMSAIERELFASE